jgi:hypothetical protein
MTKELTPREKLLAYALETADKYQGWEGELITAAEVVHRFGIPADKLEEIRQTRQVIAFPFGSDEVRFPALQFEKGGVVPALNELIPIIGSQGECWRWLLECCTTFGEITPLDFLKQGRVDEVLAEAHMQYDI